MPGEQRIERDPGLYWIDGGDDPDVARWDADAQQWLLHGSNETLDDDQVTVLSETPLSFTPD
jgi:hypothetical protein